MSEQPLEKGLIPIGNVANGYTIISLIGYGRYGATYEVKEKKTGKYFSMKVESFDSKKVTLPDEINVVKELKGNNFPKYHDSGNIEKFQVNYLVTNFLGISVEDIHMYHDHCLSIETVYNLAYKMLLVVKAFHSLGFVHQDIKPGNFLLQEKPEFPLVLIDFNLSRRFIDPETKEIIPCRKQKEFVGTKKYASINALELLSSGRNDDLVAWFYSFLDLACGSLPWEDEEDIDKLISMRQSFKVSDLKYKFPKEIQQIYDYVSKLIYDDKPDYDMIQVLLEEAMKKDLYDLSKFDWADFISKHTNMIEYQSKMAQKRLKYLNDKKEKLNNRKKNNENKRSRNVDLDDSSERKHSKKNHKRSCLIQ